MDRILCYASLGVAILMFVVFLADFVGLGPFAPRDAKDNPFSIVDIFGMLASGVVAYLAFNASKDLK
ncbi:MAG: hypothetical protein C0501_18210 [Isosphaera sp.]|nr:hypothetical protein [Isosphaera sp.]